MLYSQAMTVVEVYEKYEIPPNLADHQLTVAAVASVICEVTGKGDRDNVVAACLLHDMGNIIKFDLDKKIPGAEIENVEHWKEVKQKFIENYGDDEHIATIVIADDIGVSVEVKNLVDAIGFRHSLDTLNSGDKSKMIAGYSDMRVAPHGVVSLETRLDDLTTRYGATDDREQYNQALRQMEQVIFSDTGLNPSVVNKAVVDAQKIELVSFKI